MAPLRGNPALDDLVYRPQIPSAYTGGLQVPRLRQAAGTARPTSALTAGSIAAIQDYARQSQIDVMAGLAPGDVMPLVGQLQRTAISMPTTPAAPAARPAAAAPGSLQPGGEWGGTVAPVKTLTELAEQEGLEVSSRKRSSPSPVAGTRSDHYVGNKTAYAHDIGWGGSRPTPASDRAASAIVSALGGPAGWGKSGGNFRTVVNGIRYQVIYRSNVGGNHWNHIHLGARRE